MNNIQDIVINSQLIIDKIGYWPTFHDDEIENITYNHKTKELIFIIKCIQHKCVIEFKCSNVSKIDIENFKDQMDGNIIFNLNIIKLNSGDIKINAEPSYGSVIKVICKEVHTKKIK